MLTVIKGDYMKRLDRFSFRHSALLVISISVALMLPGTAAWAAGGVTVRAGTAVGRTGATNGTYVPRALSGTMSINGNVTFTKTHSVTINSNISDATQMRLSNDSAGAYGSWLTYSATKPWILSAGQGTKYVYAEYKDAAGNVIAKSDSIYVDTIAPSGTFKIKNGSMYTSSTTVSLDSSVTGAWQMRFRNGSTSTYSSWQPYSATKSWTLPTGDGTKYVCGEYKDRAGNTRHLDDHIVLNTAQPTGTMNINSGATWTKIRTVSIKSNMTGATQMRVKNGIAGTYGNWTAYSASKTWVLTEGDGSKSVYVQYKDAYGPEVSRNDSIQLDTTPPSGTLRISNGAMYASSRTVSLASSVTGASQMRFKNSAGVWSAWQGYSATKSWTLTAGDGTKSVCGEYKDYAGNVRHLDDSIILNTTQPTGTMSINNHAALTKNQTVTINSNMTGATQMRMKNGLSGTFSSWTTYIAAKSWTLSTGDGYKTVYVEYKDAYGPAVSRNDSIYLDTTPPSGTLKINSDSRYTSSLTVTLDSSMTGAQQMRFRNSGSSTWSYWQTYSATKSWTLPTGDGTKYVYAEYKDYAGNVRSLYDLIILDTTAPMGTMSINSGATYTTTRTVTINSAVTGASQMRIRNAWDPWPSWQTYNASKPWTLYEGDSIKYVYVQYRDNSGNVRELVDTIVLDTTPPSGTMRINNGASTTNSRSVTLNSVMTDAHEMRFRNSASSTWSTWQTYAATRSWLLTTGNGTKVVYGEYRDEHGNVRALSAGIVLDAITPAAK